VLHVKDPNLASQLLFRDGTTGAGMFMLETKDAQKALSNLNAWTKREKDILPTSQKNIKFNNLTLQQRNAFKRR